MIRAPITFRLVPSTLLSESSFKYLNFARIFKFLVLRLKTDLLQAEIDLSPEIYINMSLFASLFIFLLSLVFSLLFLSLTNNLILIPPFMMICFSIFLFVFFYSIYYPRFIAIQRVRGLESYLLTGLRHILIKVRSGVSLFQAFASLTEGYGELSKEIRILVEKVNAGIPLETALEETAAKNPSTYFRRALIQISTSIKTGADINSTLSSIINSLSESIIISAKKYGRELNFWSIFYLIISIIFPAMGISFFVMLASFVGFLIDVYTLFFIAVSFLGLQIFFLVLINSRKPSMVVF
ncbi:MAG: type II secretion system F family protein [Candidatus Aenigmatarchaeota archaeon]